jgi:hypothetical protein
MRRVCKKSSSGFTFVELMVSLVLGAMVLGVAVQMFNRGVTASFTVSQHGQMQQDVRAAQDMVAKDLSLAGSGLQPGGVALASGTGTKPIYGCDQTGLICVAAGKGVAYPCASSVGPCNPYMYWIIPGYKLGVTVNAAAGPTDIITVVYADPVFQLNCYTVGFPVPNGTSLTFTNPAVPNPGCPASPTKVTDPATGLIPGDLVLLTNTVKGSTANAVGEVSSATGASSPYTVAFNNSDPLQLNQVAATSGDMAQITSGTNTVAQRIFVITYYLDILPDPTGLTAGTPRLMRQVNGQTPVPLAENVVDLHFTYDTYDNSGNLLVQQGDAGASQGVSPNMIRKVNIAHMTTRSPLAGVKGYQGFDVVTSVSARNLSFSNRY